MLNGEPVFRHQAGCANLATGAPPSGRERVNPHVVLCCFVLEKCGRKKDNGYDLNEVCEGRVFLASGKLTPSANADRVFSRISSYSTGRTATNHQQNEAKRNMQPHSTSDTQRPEATILSHSLRIVHYALCIATAVVIAAMSIAMAETTYYVSPSGDGTDGSSWATAFRHPQDAVDAAKAAADPTGARIVIADATYVVRNADDPAVINITSGGIALEPQNASHGVIIDGGVTLSAGPDNVRRALTIASGLADVTVSGLVLTNGFAVYNKNMLASCVKAESGVISNCRMHGFSRRRNAFFYFAGNVVVTNCLMTRAKTEDFYSSSSKLDVGARVAENALVVDCVLENFGAYRQNVGVFGGVYLSSSGAVLRRCLVRGIRDVGAPRASDTQTLGAFESTGGGIYASAGTLEGYIVTNNSVFGFGGGIYIDGAVTIRNCVFWNNQATAAGNDLYVAAGKNPAITGTTASDLADDANGNTNLDPTAPFSVSGNVTVGVAPFTVSFRSADGDAAATWNFGDGGTGTGASPSHTYATPGVYDVSRTTGGATVTRTGYIVATGPTLYVSKTGSATPPYDTEAKAARHPQDAADLARNGTTIVVDDGRYTARDPNDYSVLALSHSGVTVQSAHGRGSVFIDGGTGNPANGLVRRTLVIGAGLTDVTVSGLVLSNGFMVYNTSCWPSSIIAHSGTLADTDIDVYCNRRCECAVFSGTMVYTNGNFTRRQLSTNATQNRDVALRILGSAKVVGVNFHDIKNIGNASFSQTPIQLLSASALIRNCLFHGISTGASSASVAKGGALYASAGTVENCTFHGNHAYGDGGGAYVQPAVVFRNNIAWGNFASTGTGNDVYCSDYANCTFSCASDFTAGVNGNVASAPAFADAANGDFSLASDSPVCIDAGDDQDWMAGATDLAGNPRIHGSAVDMGAYECQTISQDLIADFAVTSASTFGPAPLTVSFAATVAGGADGAAFAWDFGDGTTLPASASGSTPSHTFTSVGGYDVTLTVSKDGRPPCVVSKPLCVVVVGDVCHVSTNGSCIPPYDTWAKATTNIQAAVALQPARVIVSNGVYTLDYALDDFGLKLSRPIEVVSVGGPGVTTIDSGVVTSPSPSTVRRIATLSDAGAVLDGFTLCRACPPAVYATAGVLRNCVVTNAHGTYSAPITLFSGTAAVSNCVFDAAGTFFNHVNTEVTAVRLEGGATLSCSEVRNLSWSSSRANPDFPRGGVLALNNSVVRNVFVHAIRFTMNPGARPPAGIYASGSSTVENCTVRDCLSAYGLLGGIGVYSAGASVRNCLASGNAADDGATPIDASCAEIPAAFQNNFLGVAELPAGATGCLVGDDPLFAEEGGCALRPRSPCRDKGLRLDWMRNSTDIAGKSRLFGRPEIGCWEIPLFSRTVISLR